MAKQVGLNAIIEQTAKSIKKIRDIPNYKDSPEYKIINQQLNNQHWSTENGFVKLDTDEKIRLHQEIMYHLICNQKKFLLKISLIFPIYDSRSVASAINVFPATLFTANKSIHLP